MYNILVADDSALMRKLMCDIINSVQNFSAKDMCVDGEIAYKKISSGGYDAVVLNMSMPRMSGEDVLRQLHADGNSTPILGLYCGVEDTAVADKAMKLGTKDFIFRPFRMSPAQRPEFTKDLEQAMRFTVGDPKGSKVYKGVRRTRPDTGDAGIRSSRGAGLSAGAPARPSAAKAALHSRRSAAQSRPSQAGGLSSHQADQQVTVVHAPPSGYTGRYSLVAIASSTGGPQALHTMIPMLPGNIGVPVVIVQHMPKGFTASLAERINEKAPLTVKEAEDGEVLLKDHVYIAPGGRHLQIVANASGQMSCKVYDAPPVNNLRPCADVMYESLKKLRIDHILCAVLTGMGADGSEGIRSLKRAKDLYVITQSEDTCVVYGMPKATDVAGLSNESQPITQVASAITKKLGV